MAKAKETSKVKKATTSKETKKVTPKAKVEKQYETKEVTSVAEGEELQKQGWEFISAVRIGTDEMGLTLKKFTFRKVK